MTLFVKNAADKYDQSAEFKYEKTLGKAVTEHSLHKYKGPLIWSTGADIQCNAPVVHETYLTIVKISALDISLYIARIFMSPVNVALYGYSVNMSMMYYNISGATTNIGLPFFLLPSPVRIQLGILKFDILGIDKESTARIEKIGKKDKLNGGIAIWDGNRRKL